MNMFTQHLEAIHQHSQELQNTASSVSEEHMWLVMSHVEALRIALEELHVAEEELRQQNEELMAARQIVETERQRYQTLFEFAPDGYLVTDVYGTIREANLMAGRLLHLPPKYLLNKPLTNFVPEAERRAFRAMLSQLPTLNRVQEWEVHLQGRGNHLFEAALTIETAHNDQGESVSLRWLLRDITARKQAEEQMRLVQLENLRLVEADRLKDQFLRTLSHELRTPLTAIVGFSNLLIMHVRSHLDPRFAHMLERILDNSNHLLSLVEEILDFSKLHSNRLQLDIQPFDLAELAAQTVDQLRSLAEQKQLQLDLHLDQPSLPVTNDPRRVRQVLINLLSNAIKFTETGSVRLEVHALPKDRIQISIHDTGIGIAPENQKRIFQEFWQINQSLTRQHGGTGLGLSITYALVQLMQGKLTVHSRIEEGSIFRVELPRWLPSQDSSQIEEFDRPSDLIP